LRVLALITMALVFISCGGKSIGDRMKADTKINPLFAPKTINQKMGNGEFVVTTIKVPLTQDTVGSYDFAEIMEDESVNERSRGFLKRLWSGFKYKIYNAGIKLGVSNRVRYSTDYDDFPEIDPEFIKAVKVKKIFFAIEPCHPKDKECITRNEREPVTFRFLDKFFVNLSIVRPGDDKSYLEEPLTFLSKGDFKKFSRKAFDQIPFRFEQLANDDGEIIDDAFYDVNIARFENTRSARSYHENVRDNGKVFMFKIDNRNGSNAIELKHFFKSEPFKGIVKDVTLVGDTLYLELVHQAMRQSFFNIMNTEEPDIRNKGVIQFEGCSFINCIDLKVNQLNLVPMLQRSSHIKFDTFLSLRHLDINDFKYKGFIEIEVKLNIPL
jgi:hypothetical protein